MSSKEIEQLAQEHREVKEEHKWYRQELLEMVDTPDQGGSMWREYRDELKRTGRRHMELGRKLMERGVDL